MPSTPIEACCAPLLEQPLSPEDAELMAAAFKVLADPARLRLLSIIAALPSAEACNCDLTEPLGLSQPTVSHHLKVLAEAGLLERERRGNWVYFRLTPERFEVLRRLLSPAGAVAVRS